MLKVLGFFFALIAATLLVIISISAFAAIGVYHLPQEWGIPCLLVAGLGIYCTPVIFRATYAFFERIHIKEQHHIARQQSLKIALSNHIKESVQAAASLSALAGNADRWLEIAEQEFTRNAFAPFWDAVSAAASNLAEFDFTTRQLLAHAQQHKHAASEFEGISPPFQIGMDTLPDASRIAARMQRIVRIAQADYQFSSIFEQRRTNEILLVGFHSLTDAFNCLGDRLHGSLDQLSCVVSIGVSDFSANQQHAMGAVTTEIQTLRSEATKGIGSTRERLQQIGDTIEKIREFGLPSRSSESEERR